MSRLVLFMRDGTAFKGNLILTGAKVGGVTEMIGSRMEQEVNAEDLETGNLAMSVGATFKGNVILSGAKINGQADMHGPIFEQKIKADRLEVKGDLFMGKRARFKGDVDLSSAKIAGRVSLDDSVFERAVEIETATIGHDVFARRAYFEGPVSALFTTVVGGLDLRGSVARRIDLTGVTLGNELILGDATSQLQWFCTRLPTSGAGTDDYLNRASWPLGDRRWQSARCDEHSDNRRGWMVLRNAHVDTLQDNPRVWPPVIDIEGFKYERLGGLGGEGIADMRGRSAKEWRDWLDRDPIFSTQPYIQLASTLLSAGRRSIAEEIQYYGRQRQREEAFKYGDWTVWAWQSFLWSVAGYGIGTYTFLVLGWIFLLTAAGGAMLWFGAPNARRRGLIWCLGASLHRLLPVAKFNKEFEDFFDNPRPNLTPVMVFLCSVLALWGWLLGVILLAAVGTVAPKG